LPEFREAVHGICVKLYNGLWWAQKSVPSMMRIGHLRI